MELPKDIIQVGESNSNCKVYVEDYAVSFLKQQNRKAVDKEIVTALFGKSKSEEEKTYVFVYGAAIIKSLQKEARHLSQAQYQEIEKLRKRYFPEYELVGYRILNGEMIEGMHICEKDTFRYIAGYAQFYEKNDIMLTYMLEYKGGSMQPEVVDQQKYEMVKKRQEERKSKSEGNRKKYVAEEETVNREAEKSAEEQEGISGRERDELKEAWSGVLKKQRQGLRRMQLATVAVFAVLCVVGIYSLGNSADPEVYDVSGVPVTGPAEVQPGENVSVIRTDEKLTEALKEENIKGNEKINEDEIKEGNAGENGDGNTGGSENIGESKQTGRNGDAQETIDGTGSGAVNAGEVNGNAPNTGTGEADKPGGAAGRANETDAAGQDSSSGQGDDGRETLPDGEGTGSGDGQSGEEEAMPQESGNISPEQAEASGAVKEPVIYVIQKGDTLLGISLRVYGNTSMVVELCKVNQISDPDDIKVGQRIKLP